MITCISCSPEQTSGMNLLSEPFGYPDGMNRYEWEGSNPENRLDPTGLYLSHIHAVLTAAACIKAGCSISDTVKATYRSVAIDFDPGSQNTDADNANKHSMGGTKPDGTQQSPNEAKQGSEDKIKEAMDKAKKDKDAGALGDAMHTAQDKYASGHNYKTWDGKLTIAHVLEDAFPSWDEMVNAFNDSLDLANEYQNGR